MLAIQVHDLVDFLAEFALDFGLVLLRFLMNFEAKKVKSLRRARGLKMALKKSHNWMLKCHSLSLCHVN